MEIRINPLQVNHCTSIARQIENCYNLIYPSHAYCGRPWPAAYINIIQNTHQIQVLTEALCRAQAYILFAAEQRVGYQISWVDLQREVNCP